MCMFMWGEAFLHKVEQFPYRLVLPSTADLDKTNVPNVSSIRSVWYEPQIMKIYKASNIGTGIVIKYNAVEFENNMRVTSPFTEPINNRSSGTIQKRFEFLV